jgi:hypothetical protein
LKFESEVRINELVGCASEHIKIVYLITNIFQMGCVKSKGDAGAEVDAPLPPLDLTGLDAPTKFETVLPFKRTKLEILELKLKAATGATKSITFE